MIPRLYPQLVQTTRIELVYHALQACAEMTTLAQFANLAEVTGFEPV